MTALESARQELAELERLLRAFPEQAAEWSADWTARRSLLRRQAVLHQEISLLDGTSQVELRLVGGAENGHLVDATFLGDFLHHLQGTVMALVHAGMHGGGALRGPFPHDVVEAATLRVGASAPGSLSIVMDGPDRAQPLTIDGETPLPPFDEALEAVLNLIDASGAENDGVLGDAIADIGSHRVISHATKLVDIVVSTGTSVAVIERSPFKDGVREARLTIRAAERLRSALSRSHQDSEIVYLEGHLSGASWTRGTFDLEVPLGGDVTQTITGSIISDIRREVRDAFDRDIHAEVQRTTTRTEGDPVERVRYRLIGLGTGFRWPPLVAAEREELGADDEVGRLPGDVTLPDTDVVREILRIFAEFGALGVLAPESRAAIVELAARIRAYATGGTTPESEAGGEISLVTDGEETPN